MKDSRLENNIKTYTTEAFRATTHTLMFLTEGFAEMTIGSASYTFFKDECLLVPAGQVFAIGNVDVNSAKGFLCNFHNDIGAVKMRKPDALKDV